MTRGRGKRFIADLGISISIRWQKLVDITLGIAL